MLNLQSVDITTYVYPNMNHVFVGMHIPEAKDAINKIADEISDV